MNTWAQVPNAGQRSTQMRGLMEEHIPQQQEQRSRRRSWWSRLDLTQRLWKAEEVSAVTSWSGPTWAQPWCAGGMQVQLAVTGPCLYEPVSVWGRGWLCCRSGFEMWHGERNGFNGIILSWSYIYIRQRLEYSDAVVCVVQNWKLELHKITLLDGNIFLTTQSTLSLSLSHHLVFLFSGGT